MHFPAIAPGIAKPHGCGDDCKDAGQCREQRSGVPNVENAGANICPCSRCALRLLVAWRMKCTKQSKAKADMRRNTAIAYYAL